MEKNFSELIQKTEVEIKTLCKKFEFQELSSLVKSSQDLERQGSSIINQERKKIKILHDEMNERLFKIFADREKDKHLIYVPFIDTGCYATQIEIDGQKSEFTCAEHVYINFEGVFIPTIWQDYYDLFWNSGKCRDLENAFNLLLKDEKDNIYFRENVKQAFQKMEDKHLVTQIYGQDAYVKQGNVFVRHLQTGKFISTYFNGCEIEWYSKNLNLLALSSLEKKTGWD